MVAIFCSLVPRDQPREGRGPRRAIGCGAVVPSELGCRRGWVEVEVEVEVKDGQGEQHTNCAKSERGQSDQAIKQAIKQASSSNAKSTRDQKESRRENCHSE